MAFTRVLGPGIHTEANINSHNIKSTGIITATGLDITGNATIGGVLTYEDVTNIDSIGVVTARSGIQGIGIQSGGVNIAVGVITALNFIGSGNQITANGTTVDISIQSGGGGGGGGSPSGADGLWKGYTSGIATDVNVGIKTNNMDDADLIGIGNSFKGLYISNGMTVSDNSLSGNHYIGTAFNGLMAGPVNIDGVLTVDGNYVVI
tara:strand:+ start:570 stop:1187 length:618 start_codon:yes stop_codon:yes gene_type:complete